MDAKTHTITMPNAYAGQLFDRLQEELLPCLSPVQLQALERLYDLIQYDYEKQGLIGKGYHRLEHSLELALLLLNAWKNPQSKLPDLNRQELSEMMAAALLHDYDPYRSDGVPRVDRTLYALRTDGILAEAVLNLQARTAQLSYLITRTDYPFTYEKEFNWRASLVLNLTYKQDWEKAIFLAEKLALFDKAVTYYFLSPEQAQRRVEDLAEELKVPKGKLLAETDAFFKTEGIADVAGWVGPEYRQRWFLVEKHFCSFGAERLRTVA